LKPEQTGILLFRTLAVAADSPPAEPKGPGKNRDPEAAEKKGVINIFKELAEEDDWD